MSQINAVTTIIGLCIDLLNEILVLAIKWRKKPDMNFRELMSGKKLWFMQKLFDFPVSAITIKVLRYQSTTWT